MGLIYLHFTAPLPNSHLVATRACTRNYTAKVCLYYYTYFHDDS